MVGTFGQACAGRQQRAIKVRKEQGRAEPSRADSGVELRVFEFNPLKGIKFNRQTLEYTYGDFGAIPVVHHICGILM